VSVLISLLQNAHGDCLLAKVVAMEEAAAMAKVAGCKRAHSRIRSP